MLKLNLGEAIFDMDSRPICEASLSTRLDLVHIKVVRDLVQLSAHLLHDIVLILVRVIPPFSFHWCSYDHASLFFDLVLRLELHDSFQVFLLLGVQYISQAFLGRKLGSPCHLGLSSLLSVFVAIPSRVLGPDCSAFAGKDEQLTVFG